MKAWLGPLTLLCLWSGCAAVPEEPSTTEQADVQAAFEGNRSFPAFRLRRVIADSLLDFARDPTDEAAILDAAQDLADYYESVGFPEATVSYRIERKPNSVATFLIQEGPRVEIASLRIEGNQTVPTKDLLALWRRTNSGVLGLGNPYFVAADLRFFRAAMQDRYRADGFLEARVTGPEVDRKPQGSTANVRFRIDEGIRYTLDAVVIDPPLRAAGGSVDVVGFVRKPFSNLGLRTMLFRLRDSLEDNGYPDPRIHAKTTIDSESHLVRARLMGKPGDRRRIGRVAIRGLTRTAPHIVQRKIRIQEGAWFHGRQLEQSVADLYQTGLFSRIHVERRVREDGILDLTFVFQEAEATEVSALVGFGSYELARAAVSVGNRNLFGLGQRWQAGARVSTKSFGIDTAWTEPQLFASDTGLHIAAFLREREEPSFTDLSRGLSAAFSRKLGKQTSGRVGYGYQFRDGRDLETDGSVIALSNFHVSTLFSELTHDSRDSPLYPTSGNREAIRFEHVSPSLGSSIGFNRLIVALSYHYALSERWSLGFAARAGLMWQLGKTAVPIQERFFNGGENTVRSFREARLGPIGDGGRPAGGVYRNVFNAELRFPILYALRGAVFADAGNVGRNVHAYGLANLRYAVGAGIRLALPIGPIRFDAAVNPNPEDGERDYVVHLSVGLPF